MSDPLYSYYAIAHHNELPKANLQRIAQFAHFWQEIKKEPWILKQLIQSNDELSEFKFEIKDEKQRIHSLLVELPKEYPSKPAIFHIDLPFGKLDLNHLTISEAFIKMNERILACQMYWDQLEALDAAIQTVAEGTMVRRIAINSMTILRLELRLNDVPLVTFHGHPDHQSQWQSRWNSYCWNPKLDLIHNLETLCPLPMKKEQKVECGICFSGSPPQLSCINEQCRYQFHSDCLKEWLSTSGIPTGRYTQYTKGSCPYCQQAVVIIN